MNGSKQSEVEMGQQDKPGVWRPLGGEGVNQRAAEDEDVEGHAFERANQRASQRAAERVGEDEDVEGHAFERANQRASERAAERIGEDDDVEAHKAKP